MITLEPVHSWKACRTSLNESDDRPLETTSLSRPVTPLAASLGVLVPQARTKGFTKSGRRFRSLYKLDTRSAMWEQELYQLLAVPQMCSEGPSGHRRISPQPGLLIRSYREQIGRCLHYEDLDSSSWNPVSELTARKIVIETSSSAMLTGPTGPHMHALAIGWQLREAAEYLKFWTGHRMEVLAVK